MERNRLLVWVNDEELIEVRRLLVELGEPTPAAAATQSPATTETAARR